MSHTVCLHLHRAKFPLSLVIFNGTVLGDISVHQVWGRNSIIDMHPLCVRLVADPQRHQTQVSQTNTVGFIVIYCKLNLDFSFIQEMLLSAMCERKLLERGAVQQVTYI